VDWTTTVRRAELLGAARHELIGCRSADLFHIAVAVETKAERFVTYDNRQKKLAQAAGLKV
jgi:predicted nucleic acid-binding protein